MVTNLFEGAKAISDCHESIITAANQSEPETTRDQRRSEKPFLNGFGFAHDWLN